MLSTQLIKNPSLCVVFGITSKKYSNIKTSKSWCYVAMLQNNLRAREICHLVHFWGIDRGFKLHGSYERVTYRVAGREDLFLKVLGPSLAQLLDMLKKKIPDLSNFLPKQVWSLNWTFKAVVRPLQPPICILSVHVWSRRRSESINSTFESRQAHVKIPYCKGRLGMRGMADCCRLG